MGTSPGVLFLHFRFSSHSLLFALFLRWSSLCGGESDKIQILGNKLQCTRASMKAPTASEITNRVGAHQTLSQWYKAQHLLSNKCSSYCSTNVEQCIMWCWTLKYAVQDVESCWTLLNENRAWLYSVQQVAATSQQVPTMFNICWSTKVERCWTVYHSP